MNVTASGCLGGLVRLADETENQYAGRMKFYTTALIHLKGDIARATAMANVWRNVTILGCRYSSDVEQRLYEIDPTTQPKPQPKPRLTPRITTPPPSNLHIKRKQPSQPPQPQIFSRLDVRDVRNVRDIHANKNHHQYNNYNHQSGSHNNNYNYNYNNERRKSNNLYDDDNDDRWKQRKRSRTSETTVQKIVHRFVADVSHKSS
jgi:hypothetical protein